MVTESRMQLLIQNIKIIHREKHHPNIAVLKPLTPITAKVAEEVRM